MIDRIGDRDPDVAVLFVAIDLGDLASVREGAEEIRSKVERLDVLINNAGGEFLPFFPLWLFMGGGGGGVES